MSAEIASLFEKLTLADDAERYSALQALLKITEERVDWFEARKDELLAKLRDENSCQRSIGVMLLCNLAKSAPDKALDELLATLMPLVDDGKFITRRQYLQNIWKLALVDGRCEEAIVGQLRREFADCAEKKHCNLLRLDIVASLLAIMNEANRASIGNIVGELINLETDERSRKKYIKLLETAMSGKAS